MFALQASGRDWLLLKEEIRAREILSTHPAVSKGAHVAGQWYY